jgi:prophage tail gpP-like protein
MPGIQGENVELLIGGKNFAHWFDFEFKYAVDSFHTVSFKAPFEPKNKAFRDLFLPFSFAPVQFLLNGDSLFTGTMLTPEPDVSADSSSVTVNCYSLPGVLEDCEAPSGFGRKGRRSTVGAIPLEFKGLTLQAIANQLCAPFGITVIFRGDPGAPFAKVAIKIEEKIHKFLVELAKQRGFVMTNDVNGNLIFWKAITQGAPVVQFVAGVPPFVGLKANFSPRDYFSEITGYAPAKHRKAGSHYTVLNPWLGDGVDDGSAPINNHRPTSCKFDDTERQDAPDATLAKMGRMFANLVNYDTGDLPTWRDPDGKLWDVNTSVTALAPSAMIYRETELLIREVTLKQSKDKLCANLNLVLPGAFSGRIPETLPWIV